MKTIFLPVIFILAFPIVSSAASPAPDSIGVKKVEGKTYVVHKIETAEGWFSIARRYGISYAELRMANKDSADKLVPGSTLLVPVVRPAANDPFYDKNYLHADENYYQVKEGETLFSIAKKFNTNVDSLKKWNRLADADLKTGRRLKVGYKRKDEKETASADVNAAKKIDTSADGKKIAETVEARMGKPPVVHKSDTSKLIKKDTVTAKNVKAVIPAGDSTKMIKTASNFKTDAKKPSSPNTGKGRKEVYENGVASWIRDDDINPNKYYALHRSAPIGTIIKVTNKMNNKYVFVKVVGTLPDTGDNTDLVIKISKASAEKLGVRDSRFQSELNYGVNEKP
jgi:LysM repeat protein